MDKLLFSLNFGCMKFITRRQENHHTLSMSHDQNRKKTISVLRLINNLSFFTGAKSTIQPLKKDKRSNQKYSVGYRYTKSNNILSYIDSSGTGKPSYNVLFDYHSLLVIYYLFGMFNTGIYTCLRSTYNRGELLVTGSKLGTYYIQDYMNSSTYKRPVNFMITGQEQILNIISKKSNIIPLTISYMISVLNNIKTRQFYSNIEELKKLLTVKNKEICKSKETKDISSHISVICKITKHIIDLYFQNNIFSILFDRSKEIESTFTNTTYLSFERLALNVYFDISTLTFIIKNSFDIRLMYFDLGRTTYDTIMRNYVYVLVDNKNKVSIKYTIEQHNIEQKEYKILYQDKLNYEDIKDKKHSINYQNLWEYYKEQIQNKIVGKIFR